MKHETIATVTVTYNRKDLLLKNIEAIMSQNCNIDCIIIVDNHSTDNTKEAVLNTFPNGNIKYIYLDENTGGAGGFYTGCKYAFENNYDWVVLMDDDGKPQNADTIKNLLKEVEKKGLTSNDSIMLNSLVLSDNKKLSFGLFNMNESIEDIKPRVKENIIRDKINPFNGTLISRKLMESIGFPNKDFFVICDEQDYYYRALNAEAYVATVFNSLYYHPAAIEKKLRIIKFLGKNYAFSIQKPWKEYYATRNHTYVYRNIYNKKQKRNYIIKKIIGALLFNEKRLETLKMVIKGYRDGKKGKLGKTVIPK